MGRGRRPEPPAGRSGRDVVGLATEPLDVAERDAAIVDVARAGVAGDEVERAVRANARGGAADHDGELDLGFDITAARQADDRVTVTAEGCLRTCQKERGLGASSPVSPVWSA